VSVCERAEQRGRVLDRHLVAGASVGQVIRVRSRGVSAGSPVAQERVGLLVELDCVRQLDERDRVAAIASRVIGPATSGVRA
jgi:hypothetical protein